MTYLRLLWLHLRLGILNELQYRANLFLQILQSTIGLATALIGLWFVFSKTDSLGGWGPSELLAIVGVYYLVGGVAQLVVLPSLNRFMEDVRLGTFDFALTKPVDAQVLASTRQFEVWKGLDVLLGFIVLAVALARLGATIGPLEAAVFAVTLLSGVTVVYSFLLILATCAFWFIRVQNILVIYESVYEAGRWPVGIYPPWLRAILTFVVPVGLAITVPAAGLVGRLEWSTLLGAVALAASLPLVARWFWRVGLRHYSGASA
jgi:ABC-2 type transport system permease protein